MKLTTVFAGLLALTPAALLANSGANAAAPAPPLKRTGAAVDGGLVCNQCHNNPNGALPNVDPRGKLIITAGNYTPGTRQNIRVRLEHPEAQRWGFQLAARLASDPARQAGSFTVSDDVQVRCDDGQVRGAPAPCADGQLQFASHTAAGTSAGTGTGRTWEVAWTPPAAGAGDVIFYAAGNAANNSNSNQGDQIYTTQLRIAAGTGNPRPSITANGVADGWSYQPGVASSTWLAIFGTNLSSTTRTWDAAISGSTLPTTLDDVTVSINNRPATIFFVSPTQVNVLAPIDTATGDVTVAVNNSLGAGELRVRKAAFLPAFYSPFGADGRLFVTALASDLTIVGKPGVDPRVQRGVLPGEVIALFGTGFGPTNPAVETNQVVSGTPAVVNRPTIRFGTVEAQIVAGGTGNLVQAGLYQFNVTVPANLAAGDVALTAEVGGVRSSDRVFITIQP